MEGGGSATLRASALLCRSRLSLPPPTREASPHASAAAAHRRLGPHRQLSNHVAAGLQHVCFQGLQL